MSSKIDINDPINKAILEAIFDFTPINEIHYRANTTNKSVLKRLRKLKAEGYIELHQSGLYQLVPKEVFHKHFKLNGLSESEVFEMQLTTLEVLR